jgi:hypothetical protein
MGLVATVLPTTSLGDIVIVPITVVAVVVVPLAIIGVGAEIAHHRRPHRH